MSRDHDKIRKLVRSIILEDAKADRPANIYITSTGEEFAVPTFKSNEPILLAPDVNSDIEGIDDYDAESAEQPRPNNFNSLPAGLYRSSVFLSPRERGRKHKAVDYTGAQIAGKPVLAALGGRVISAPDNRGSSTTGYGNEVKIDHNDGLVTHYAHLGTVLVNGGQAVNRGDEIGTVGNSGHIITSPGGTGHHLHFGLYKNNSPIDPLTAPELDNAVFPVKMN